MRAAMILCIGVKDSLGSRPRSSELPLANGNPGQLTIPTVQVSPSSIFASVESSLTANSSRLFPWSLIRLTNKIALYEASRDSARAMKEPSDSVFATAADTWDQRSQTFES